ncbi:hypothetical protein PROPEN_02758 [Proteus penneri ATCC 35198]|nr:hypothetical protein PROPEN_02758 [Proteus penneri ATCC 35198]
MLSVTNKLLVLFDGHTKLFGSTTAVIAELNKSSVIKSTPTTTPITQSNI